MASPWLDIPLADYEGHMEHVGQARMLERVFGHALRMLQPQSVAVLGAAGGDGFEHLVGSGVTRTAAVDINPEYLQALERRFGSRVPGLAILCGDLDDPAIDFAPVDLILAALIFEYVDIGRALQRARAWLRPLGTLWVVLQLAGTDQTAVTPSSFGSLARLGSSMKLQDAGRFRDAAAKADLAEISREILTLPGGKRFLSASFAAGAFGRPGQKV